MAKSGLKKMTSVVARACAGLLMVSVSGYAVADAQRTNIDAALNTSSYKVVTDDSVSDENLYPYEGKKITTENIDGKTTTFDCTTLRGTLAYQKDVSMRMAAEGAVLLKNSKSTLPLNTPAKKNVT